MSVRLEIEVVKLEPTPVVVRSQKVDRGPLERSIRKGILSVRQAVTAGGVPTSGPPFVRYLSFHPRLEIEIGLPLDAPHSVPTLRTTVLPGGEAASLWLTGRHARLAYARDRLHRWVDDNAEAYGDPWEWYWTDPDADEPRVQVVWPVTLPP